MYGELAREKARQRNPGKPRSRDQLAPISTGSVHNPTRRNSGSGNSSSSGKHSNKVSASANSTPIRSAEREDGDELVKSRSYTPNTHPVSLLQQQVKSKSDLDDEKEDDDDDEEEKGAENRGRIEKELTTVSPIPPILNSSTPAPTASFSSSFVSFFRSLSSPSQSPTSPSTINPSSKDTEVSFVIDDFIFVQRLDAEPTPPPAEVTPPPSPPQSPLEPPSPPSPSDSILPFYTSPQLRRGQLWIHYLTPATLSSRFTPHLYNKLIHTHSSFEVNIRKDIGRTFPTHALFKQEKTRKMLFNILKAYSCYDMDVGYSQGMAFIVGFLLLHHNKEEEIFWLFVKLMFSTSHSLRSLYLDDCIGLKTCLAIVQSLLDTSPALLSLSVHLKNEGIDVSIFVTQWLVTIYSYRFTLEFTQLVWDRYIESGLSVLISVALALLEYGQETLLTMKFEYIIPYLTVGMSDVPISVVEYADSIILPAAALEKLESIQKADKKVRTLKG